MKTKIPSVPIYKLIPHLLTIFALCLGISAVRYALDGKFIIAAGLIIISAVMDSLDGRIARLLNCTSDFGAQLDSLADIVSFGVAPALVAYLWSMHEIPYKGVGWSVVLFYITCNALRLARFNVGLQSTEESERGKQFFIGVPVTAAACLSLLPMISTFELVSFQYSYWFTAGYLVSLGLLMVSRLPTFSGKYVEVEEKHIPFFLTMGCLLCTGLILEPWITIPLIGLLYLLSIPVAILAHYKWYSN
ncbi:MAG: CDP-diacylglycerol--serine O-phosphatidyltransferase [Proteobacteria bacterium]|nr:CDP-diacylglycerol--serine O-phosphatidyltransferase [Pseudomonadota bacterium]